MERAIRATGTSGLQIVPSDIRLAGAEVELVPQIARETKLREAVRPVEDRYDLVLIDCPPSLGLLTINALTAASACVIPVQCEFYALEGLTQLMDTISLVRRHLNPDLSVAGVVLTMIDPRTRLSDQVADEVRRHFSELVFETVIPRSVRLAEAPSYGLPVLSYAPSSRGAEAYRSLAAEFLRRIGMRTADAASEDSRGLSPVGQRTASHGPATEGSSEGNDSACHLADAGAQTRSADASDDFGHAVDLAEHDSVKSASTTAAPADEEVRGNGHD